MRISTIKNKKIISYLLWLAIWSLISRLLNNNILLPSPSLVLKTLLLTLRNPQSWGPLINSISKISLGIFFGILLGFFLANISFFFNNSQEFINIFINFIQTTPLASLVIILLIWISSERLAFFIVLFIVLPTIYRACLSGLNNSNKKLLELAQVFNISFNKKYRFIYWENLKKYLFSSITSSINLAWKAGISGEILSLSQNTIGENIYYSKLYLDSAQIFSWTLIIIFLSKSLVTLVNFLLRRLV